MLVEVVCVTWEIGGTWDTSTNYFDIISHRAENLKSDSKFNQLSSAYHPLDVNFTFDFMIIPQN